MKNNFLLFYMFGGFLYLMTFLLLGLFLKDKLENDAELMDAFCRDVLDKENKFEQYSQNGFKVLMVMFIPILNYIVSIFYILIMIFWDKAKKILINDDREEK